MKKLKLSAIVVCMVMVAALCFSGCEFLNGAQYLTVKEMPKTQFTQDESWTLSEDSLKAVGFSFTIQVKNSEGTHTYVFGRPAATGETAITMGEGATQFSIKGFDLSKTGSHLATIKIGSANGSFQYQVIGNGKGTSESDAIKISTVEDFYKMEAWNRETWAVDSSKKDVYYELTNDIDFGVVDDSILNAFSGHLNGKGHKITATFTNKGNTDPAKQGTFKGTGLVFIIISDAEIKNIDFDLAGGDNSICRNMLNKVVMNNVDRYGSCDALRTNRGLYVAQFCGFIYGGELMMVKENGAVTGYAAINRLSTPLDVTMIECDNYATISSTNETVSAYFAYGIGYDSDNYTSKLTMERCNNYGTVSGENSSVFLGNGSFVKTKSLQKSVKVSLTDCYNYGKVQSGVASNVIMSHVSDAEVEKYPIVNVKAGDKQGNACAAVLNKELEGGIKGTCMTYKTVSLKDIAKAENGLLTIDSTAVKNEIGAVAYYRMSAWFEANVYGKDASGLYNDKITNTKQYLDSKQYNAPASGLLTTDYYFLSATTGEGTIATEVGRMLLEKESKKYYAFQESVDSITDTATKLGGAESKVEFRIYCYDANHNVIGYVGFNSLSTIGK